MLRNAWLSKRKCRRRDRSIEAVDGAALALERVDYIQGGDGLPARVFSVGDGVLDHILEKGLDDGARFLVNLARDSLDSATPRQATDCRLGDARDIAFAAFAEALGTALAQSLASFAAAGHVAR